MSTSVIITGIICFTVIAISLIPLLENARINRD